MKSKSTNHRKHYSFKDRFGWWWLGFGMFIVSWLVQICILFTPFFRKHD
ncbi:MAG: hypothetical protein II707_02940 [Spirochaetales bacterium]|nr:hypothetical protein [Spirochaetales bacterium]